MSDQRDPDLPLEGAGHRRPPAAGEVDLRPGRGRFFGRGPRGYRRSDARIHEEICDRLTTHPDIDASDVEVDVAAGVVTMTGSVDTRHEKRLAELIADDTLGVDDVNNRLTVRRGFWASIASDRALHRTPHREPGRGARDSRAPTVALGST